MGKKSKNKNKKPKSKVRDAHAANATCSRVGGDGGDTNANVLASSLQQQCSVSGDTVRTDSHSHSHSKNHNHNHNHKPGPNTNPARTDIDRVDRGPGPTPKDGWARELRQAEKALKENPENEELILRTAKAYLTMRYFGKLRKLNSSCVSLSSASASTSVSASVSESASASASASTSAPSVNESNDMSPEGRKQLDTWIMEARREEDKLGLKRDSKITDPQMVQILDDVFSKDDSSIDRNVYEDNTFGVLNILQFAAARGDIRLLERLIALGAALDYRTQDYSPTLRCYMPGVTALLVTLVNLISAQKAISMGARGLEKRQMKKHYKGGLQIAIQLVWLGADCDGVKVPMIPQHANQTELAMFCKIVNVVGKSPRQLAHMLGEEELLDAMRQLDTVEKKIELVHCRCGSRLPWKDCHSSKEVDLPYYQVRKNNNEEPTLTWRYSPLAACHCKKSKKTHFRCCWEEGFRVAYQDDTTGEFIQVLSGTGGNPMVLNSMSSVVQEVMQDGSVEDDDVFTPFANLDFQKEKELVCGSVRKMSQSDFDNLSKGFHPKSRLGEWDTEVYAGTMERLDGYFYWNDIHWQVSKTELLIRTKEWNEALDKYCDDIGLKEEKRDEVIRRHTANPLAPCANLECDTYETKVKEFRKCARCSRVAYCSVDCQRQDWKCHKKRCVSRKEMGTNMS